MVVDKRLITFMALQLGGVALHTSFFSVKFFLVLFSVLVHLFFLAYIFLYYPDDFVCCCCQSPR